MISKFRNLGFGGPFSGGKHLFMIKGKLILHVGNPHNGDVSDPLLSKIIKQGGVSRKDWDKA